MQFKDAAMQGGKWLRTKYLEYIIHSPTSTQASRCNTTRFILLHVFSVMTDDTPLHTGDGKLLLLIGVSDFRLMTHRYTG